MHHGWYKFNVRGDVVGLRYDVFGNEQNASEADRNPFRFAGEYLDFETGNYYLRARHFNPRTSRFTQADPHWNVGNMVFGDTTLMRHGVRMPNQWAIMQSGNLYAYTMGNPVMWTDPSGRVVKSVLLAVKIYRVVSNLQRISSGNSTSVASSAAANIGGATSSAPTAQPRSNERSTGSSSSANVGTSAGASMTIPQAPAMSRSDARAIEEELRRNGHTPIFRGGSGNATNMTLRPLPDDPSGALSFYLKPPSGKFTITTIEIVNATGVLTAVKDGANHASVKPIDVSRTQEWRDSKENALEDPHEFTRIMMSITVGRVRAN